MSKLDQLKALRERKFGKKPKGSRKSSGVSNMSIPLSLKEAIAEIKKRRGRPKGEPTEGKMVHLPPGLWGRIDDYQEEHEYGSRTAAIRALLERGLK